MSKLKSKNKKLKTQIKNSKIFAFLVCVFCFWFFIFCLPCLAQDASKEEESLFVAKKAFEDGFYEVSLGLLERFLNNYPNSPYAQEVNLLIGECYFHQARFLEALAKFEGLLNQPASATIKDALLYWIAEVHFKGNSFDTAGNFYKRIIEEFPKSSYCPSAYYSLGWCLFQEQKFREAMVNFEIVEEKYPKEPQAKDAPFKIIECLYNLKDYATLKARLKNYLKIYAKDAIRLSYLYFYMAESDYYLNNFNEAIEGYALVLKNNRDDKIQALSKLGISWSYLKLKRYKEAEDAFSDIKREDLDKRSIDIFLLGRAILYQETNKAFESKSIYDELLAKTGDHLVLIQAYLGKADCFYALASYKEAIDVYKEALDKANTANIPGEIIDKLHYGLSWSYLKQGEFREAISEFQKIVKETEDKTVKVSALCHIGDAYQDSGDYDRARETYDSILKDYPDSFYGDYVQYQLGITMLKASNYEGAILSFASLKRNFPESKLLDDAGYALGLAYFQKQDYNASTEVFRKFQEEFKDSSLKAQALYLLGTSLYNLGKFNEAIDVFKDISRFYSQDIKLVQKAEYEIADCFYQLGDEKEAMNRFKMLRSKYPDSLLTAEVIWWLGGYYYRHNELDLARRYFSSLIQDFPKSNLIADGYYALGSISEEESKHEEAIKFFKKAIELGKTDLAGQAITALADIYVKQEKKSLAQDTYREIIKDYPNLASLIYPKMADLFYKEGNLTGALDFYRKCLDVVPIKEMADIQFKIAEVCQAQGDLTQAVEEYLKVNYLYSQNNALSVKSLLRVAAIYEDKEDFKEAQNIYKRIISMNTQEARYAQERIDWIKAHVK